MTRDTRSRRSRWRATRTALAAVLFLLAAVSARALGSCTFTVVTAVSFGSYDALNTNPLDQTGSVTFNCSLLALQTLTVDLSKGNSATYSSREMRKGGGGTLLYNLYLDAARTLVWGDATGGTVHFGPYLPLLGQDHTVTIYGRIPARQASPAGAYTDTVVATINF
jgi:spore coat protein U domain-containing protein, fimbrial subunit CupE1/2/3/6